MTRGRLRAVSLVVGTTGAMLLAFGGPALAANPKATVSLASPSSDGMKLTSTTAISGTVDEGGGGSLAITGPSAYNYVQNVPAGTIGQTTSVSCAFNPRSGGCGSGAGVLPNGIYTVTVSSKAYSKPSGCGTLGRSPCPYDANSQSRTFWLAAAPAVPAGVSAEQVGDRGVHVSWTAGDEPDLLTYDLLDGSNHVLYPGIKVDDPDFCTSTECHIDVVYPDDDPGGQKDFRVRSWRADGKGEQLGSAASSVASASLPAPTSTGSDGDTGGDSGGGSVGDDSGSGSTGGDSGGSTGGSGGGSSTDGGVVTGGSGSGGSTSGSGGTSTAGGSFGSGFAGSPGLTFTTSSGHVTIPRLPGSGGEGANPNPKVAIPWGTYDKSLGYQDQVRTDKVREKTLSTRFVTTLSAFTNGPRLWKSLAGALVLILIGAHMRVFTRSVSYE